MLIPYAAAAFITGMMYLEGDLSAVPDEDVQSIKDFLNAAGSPQEITVENPAAASGETVGAKVSYPQTPIGWANMLARSVSLTGPIWEPWTAPIRFVLYLLAVPGLIFLSLTFMSALSNFLSRIGGRATV